MKEVFQKFNNSDYNEIIEIIKETSPEGYIGSSITKHHRLLIFLTTTPEYIYILTIN